MLALVKKPRIELSIHGERVDELLEWIEQKYDVVVFSTEDAEESVPIEETEFWKEMKQNRIGNLLAGARYKAGLTQAQVAEQVGVRQNMISDYERGRRRFSPSMAKRLSEVLKVKEERLAYGGERGSLADGT